MSSAMIQNDEAILWQNFKKGSEEALAQIYRSYFKILFNYGLRFNSDKELVQDCIQDLFLDLCKSREKLSDTTSIRFYLLRSLRRKIIKKLTYLGRFKAFFQENKFEVEFSHEAKIIQEQIFTEKKEHLEKALHQLTKRQQEAIYLKFYNNMSYEEISGIMDINLQSIRNLIHQSVKTLKIEMEK